MLAAPGRLPTLPQLTPRRSNSRRLGFPAACSVLSLHQISGRCRRSSLLLAWKQVEWVDLRSSEADDSDAVELPLMPLPAVYLPSPSQQLMVSEERYLKLYDDILVNGSRMFLVCHSRGSLVGRCGLVFKLTNLRDVAEEFKGHTKYVADHEVRQRARIVSVLNPQEQDSKSSYLKAKVRFFDADPTEEEMERSTSTALQRIRQKMRDALAIQGDMEQAQELGDLARRLRLASVIRSPGFWDLCSMLGSIQSFRLQLDIREMRDHVRRLTEEWAEQNPQDVEALKQNPKVLPARIRSQGERVRELLMTGTEELQSTFQQILQTPALGDAAQLLEQAVDEELHRMRTLRSLNTFLEDPEQPEHS